MKATRFVSLPKAFTLIELLCVMAVIGILASLLLPVVNRGRARAKIIGCINNLRQVGLAFQSFGHDHNGQFPMSVPANAGGSEEFTTTSYQLTGEFFFSFRHFQALSNDLGSPKLLACPADTRLPAATFAYLNNKNLSYFVGLRADYAKPYSVLAGDRNLTNDYDRMPTVLRPQLNRGWRWTRELHEFKGNLLFADGHVEDKTSQALAARLEQLPFVGELALPNLPRAGTVAPIAFNPTVPSSAVLPRTPAAGMLSPPSKSASKLLDQSPSPGQPTSIVITPTARPPLPTSAGSDTPPITNTRPAIPTTRATTGPAEKPGANEEPGFSFFPVSLGTSALDLLKSSAWLLYVLLLLAGTAFSIRMLSRRQRPDRKEGFWDDEEAN
jgi:prepilin-type N-terminal cleavage/methylation domain-containing protein/prepilin-type processing-associated H-X9-DG protein